MMTNLPELYNCFLKANLQICTDTRKEVKDSFFVCLKGENHDANTIAEKAKEAGAMFVLTNRKDLANNPGYLVVEDTLTALQDLANYHRKELGITLIAIGGSNGKTTTKELLYSILSQHLNVHATPGNFNNHIGVPLTLLQLRSHHDLGIIEMGINHPDEMTELCTIAEPNEGVLTNIGKEHLEGFGSIEGVARAESELFDYLLKHEGLCYINLDDTWIESMSKRLPKQVSFSTQETADVYYAAEEINPRIVFNYQGIAVQSVLSGSYNFSNIVTAVAIAEQHQIPAEKIAAGITQYVPSNNRSEWKTTEQNEILVDCYNANPSSMELAIENVLAMPEKDKLFFVGDMLELGDHAVEEHLSILNMAQQNTSSSNHFIFVGPEFYKHKDSYAFSFFNNTEECISHLKGSELLRNKLILLKASRGIKLENLLTIL